MGHHAHLNVAGNAQVALYALLGGGGLLQLVVGGLQFLVGGLQLLVGPLQAASRTDAEDDEHGECQNDDAHDDHHQAELLALLLHLHALLLALQLVDVELGAHLVELVLGVGTADGVARQVHGLIEAGGLLEVSQTAHDVGTLRVDGKEDALVLVGTEEAEAVVVQVECLLQASLLESELGHLEEPRAALVVVLRDQIGVGLSQRLFGLRQLVESHGSLRTGYLVVEPEDVLLAWVELLLGNEALKESLPAHGEVRQCAVLLLGVEHVAVVGIDLLRDIRQGGDVGEDVEALQVGGSTLVEVVGVEVDVTHGVVGNALTIDVLARKGIVAHGLHFAKGCVLAVAIIYIGVDEVRPRLVVLVPPLQLAQRLQVFGHVANDGVGQAVVVESQRADGQSLSQQRVVVGSTRRGDSLVYRLEPGSKFLSLKRRGGAPQQEKDDGFL